VNSPLRLELCRARSLLFVPASRPERFNKALASGADVVIIDLEDAVAVDAKQAARAALADWLSPERPVVVRINAPGTPWHFEDAALCAHIGVAAVMCPKAEREADLEALCDAGVRALIPLVETAVGIAALDELALAPGVERLALGTIDLQVDLGMRDASEDELLYFRSRMVLASRLANLAAPIDGVSVAIDDTARLEIDVLRSRRLGFGGKLCIHPRQVATVARGFRPSETERAWAYRVLDAAAAAGGAVVRVDGEMVDQPVVLRAQATLRDW
jgi:citrate lyase subunit beta/citryl-CoA lyase